GVCVYTRRLEVNDGVCVHVHLRSARRLCELCCANRGTFIKVGQHLGALDYLLPEEYTSTLKVLHSQAPQSSMKEVRQVIREDLGKENFTVPKRTLFSKAFLPSPITKLKFSFLKKIIFISFFPFLIHPTLTSMHEYWKNHSLD
ncbi:hypothetical protein FD755_024733, partial [Muntiacus reevesi]